MRNEQYLFCWDKVPEIDNDKLIEFLKNKFKIKWYKDAIIEKIDDGKTIKVLDNGKKIKKWNNSNNILLSLNNQKTIVNIESYYNITNKKRTDELIPKIENGMLNIYAEHINIRILRNLLEKPKQLRKLQLL